MSEAELDSPRRDDKALNALRKRKYKRVNLPAGRAYIDPCPVHTPDDAILWLAEINAGISFGRLAVAEDRKFVFVTSKGRQCGFEIGANGFDARGALMTAARALWFELNGLIDEQPKSKT